MPTSFFNEGEFLVSMALDGTGQEDWSEVVLPSEVPAGIQFIGAEALAVDVLVLAWFKGYQNVEPEGLPVRFANGQATLHPKRGQFSLRNDPSWWTASDREPFPRYRWRTDWKL